MHSAILKTTFGRVMNLLMRLALEALVGTIVFSEKKKKTREKASVLRH